MEWQTIVAFGFRLNEEIRDENTTMRIASVYRRLSVYAGLFCVFVMFAGCSSPAADDKESAKKEEPKKTASKVREAKTDPDADFEVDPAPPAAEEDPVESSDPPVDNPLEDVLATDPTEVHDPNAAVTTVAVAEKPAQNTFEPFWDKPLVTLFITGRQEGYIEPCGCTGLKNQKGGMNRKHDLLRTLNDWGWNPVALDAGNQVKRRGRQAEIKFHTSVDGLKLMNYQAVGIGPNDLRLTPDEVITDLLPVGDTPSPFVCANANLLGLVGTTKVITAGGKKIGVTAVLGDENRAKAAATKSDELELKPAADALKEVWPVLEAEKCDLYVLLANATIDESKALAEAFPSFQMVVTSGGFGEPPFQPDSLNDGKTWLVQIGTKGMYVGLIGMFDGPEPLKYKKVSLDARFEDTKEMMQLLKSYQDILETEGVKKLVGLDAPGKEPPMHPTGRTFVGSEMCGECHSTAHKIWRKTPHSYALDTLVKPPERYSVPRHLDPECISCHVVGWNAQEYFPYKSGYLGLKETPEMHHVGCENCHGPGSTHVDAENGDIDATDDQLEAFRQQMILSLEEAEEHCKQCHDLDNSPDFHKPGAFEEYWEKIEHVGKD